MADPTMYDYRAYLFAREIAESFVIAYAKAPNDDYASFYRERGLEEFRKMAAHLGFELVALAEQKDAA